MEGSNLLRLVQEKLSEKEEIIHEQQRQITELQERLGTAEPRAAVLAEALQEKDAVIREMMQQVEEAASVPPDTGEVEEQHQIITEQMQQIIELTDRVEQLQAELQRAQEALRQHDHMQAQLKEMLGEKA